MELRSVLSTKTLNDKAVILAHSLGMSLTCVDFIQINKLAVNLSSIDRESFDSVVFTSANGVKYFFDHDDAKKIIQEKGIFSLSEKTSSELLSHNIRADYIKKNAVDLALTMIKLKGVRSVLHICGTRRMDALESFLKKAGINYTQLIVYETEIKNIPLSKGFDVILFYSPSGVQGFFAANQPGEQTVFCCIGETTHAELKKHSACAKVILPDAPSPEAMIKSVGEYFRNKPGA
jgi:uroporphyrinogen-III synthase